MSSSGHISAELGSAITWLWLLSPSWLSWEQQVTAPVTAPVAPLAGNDCRAQSLHEGWPRLSTAHSWDTGDVWGDKGQVRRFEVKF